MLLCLSDTLHQNIAEKGERLKHRAHFLPIKINKGDAIMENQERHLQYKVYCANKAVSSAKDVFTGCTLKGNGPNHQSFICRADSLDDAREKIKKRRLKPQVYQLHDTICRYLVKEYFIVACEMDDADPNNTAPEHNNDIWFYPLHFTIVHSDAYGDKLKEDGDYENYEESLKEGKRIETISKDFITIEVLDVSEESWTDGKCK